MATKQKIRIRLKAFDHRILDQSALQIVETAETKHKAPVVDILEALKMSLAEVKKPIRSSVGTPAVPVEEDRPARKSRKTGG